MKKLQSYEVYLKKGQADLRTSMKLLEIDSEDYDIICFHFQQFIEKYFKSFLLFNKIKLQKVHDIGLLLAESIKIDNEFSRYEDTELIELTDCGVSIRYDEIEEIDRAFLDDIVPLIVEPKSLK